MSPVKAFTRATSVAITAFAAFFAILSLAGCAGSAPVNPGALMIVQTQIAPWNSDRTSGQAITSDHYRIFTTSRNRALLEKAPGFMEAAYDNYLLITGLPELPPAEPMPIYLMGNRNEWAALTRGVTKGQSSVYLSISAGGYCLKGVCVFWDLGGLATLSVASHEGMHQFLYHRLIDRLPMWLEEGLGTMAEGYAIIGQRVKFTPRRNVTRFDNLRNAILQNYWIPLETLLPMDAGDAVSGNFTEKAVGYYGQLWALVQYIRSVPEYDAGMKRLFADAAAGRLHEAMGVPRHAFDQLHRRGRIYNRSVAEVYFKYYITDDLPAFEKQFKAFARKLVQIN